MARDGGGSDDGEAGSDSGRFEGSAFLTPHLHSASVVLQHPLPSAPVALSTGSALPDPVPLQLQLPPGSALASCGGHALPCLRACGWRPLLLWVSAQSVTPAHPPGPVALTTAVTIFEAAVCQFYCPKALQPSLGRLTLPQTCTVGSAFSLFWGAQRGAMTGPRLHS